MPSSPLPPRFCGAHLSKALASASKLSFASPRKPPAFANSLSLHHSTKTRSTSASKLLENRRRHSLPESLELSFMLFRPPTVATCAGETLLPRRVRDTTLAESCRGGSTCRCPRRLPVSSANASNPTLEHRFRTGSWACQSTTSRLSPLGGTVGSCLGRQVHSRYGRTPPD